MKKGAAAPIKSLRLAVLYCNDSYFIQLYFWCIRPEYPVIHLMSRLMYILNPKITRFTLVAHHDLFAWHANDKEAQEEGPTHRTHNEPRRP